MDLQENLKGIERRIDPMRQVHAPDEPGGEDNTSGATMAVTWSAAVRGYR